MNIKVILIFLLTQLSLISLQPTWEQKPMSQIAKLGSDVVMHCHIKNRDKRDIIWIQIGDSSVLPLFVNDKSFNAPDIRYSVEAHDDGYDLKIRNITRNENKIYQCQLQNSELKHRIKLTVIEKPQKMSIHIFSKQAMNFEKNPTFISGEKIRVECTTEGGNPRPEIEMYKNNEKIESKFINMTDVITTKIFSSILLKPQDNLAEFQCKIINHSSFSSMDFKTKDFIRKTRKINIFYRPNISIRPFNPLYTLTGSNVSVECETDSNPLAKRINWYQVNQNNEKDIVSYTKELYLFNVDNQENNSYTCEAENSVGKSAATFNLFVQEKPIVKIDKTIIKTVEGENVKISCSSIFNKFYDLNTSEIYWKFEEYNMNQKDGEHLKDRDIIYTYNRETDGSTYFYKNEPKNATNKHDSKSDNVKLLYVNETINDAKKTQENYNYKFKQIHIQNITRDQAGKYTCFSKCLGRISGNIDPIEIFSDESVVNINVEYGPTHPSILVDSIGSNDVSNVIVGKDFQFSCYFSDFGNPPGNRYWKFFPNDESKEIDLLESFYDQNTKTSILVINQISLENEGTYECGAYNKISRNSIKQKLSVNVRPNWIGKLIEKSIKVQKKDLDNFYLSCSVLSKPAANIDWFFQSFNKSFNEENQLKPTYSVDVQKRNNFSKNQHFEYQMDEFSKFLDNGVQNTTSIIKFVQSENKTHKMSGKYTCIAKNPEIDDYKIIQSTNVVVYYKPILSTPKNIHAININKPTILRCFIESNPYSEVEWEFYNTDDQLVKDFIGHDKIKTNMTKLKQESIGHYYMSQLILNNAQTENIGNYMCKSKNSQGKTMLKFTVLAQGKPFVPKNIKIVNINPNRVMISWNLMFDGGLTSKFKLFLKEINTRRSVIVTSLKDHIYLNKLNANTEYQLIISAINQYGESEKSKIQKFKTLDYELVIPNLMYNRKQGRINHEEIGMDKCLQISMDALNVNDLCIRGEKNQNFTYIDPIFLRFSKLYVRMCYYENKNSCSKEISIVDSAQSVQDNIKISSNIIISVGCICCIIVIILITILIYLCIRKHKSIDKQDYHCCSGQDSGSKNNSSNLNKNPYVSNNDITSQYSCGECGNSVNVFENFYNLTNQFKNNTQQKAVYWNNDTTGAFNESGTLKRKMFEIVV